MTGSFHIRRPVIASSTVMNARAFVTMAMAAPDPCPCLRGRSRAGGRVRQRRRDVVDAAPRVGGAARSHLHRIRDLVLTHTIPSTLSAIGDERLAWLRTLPRRWSDGDLSVVHAWPDDVWPITPVNASDEELDRVYGVLRSKHVVYGHFHQPFVRRLSTFTAANSGAVSLSYDGDRRAAYALVEAGAPACRRAGEYRSRPTSTLRGGRDPDR